MPSNDPLSDLDERARRELVALFAREAPRQQGELHRALSRRDAEGVAAVAHTLAGSACYFDAGALEQVCRRIEAAARVDLDSVHALLPEFDESLGVALLRAMRAAGPG
jgi:HPt (histidine-containing phosphotransfer) domain-containing protein